jgi:hypothetical protein
MSREKLPPLSLEPDQRMAVEKIISEDTMSALNASLMGSGKTLMAIEAVKGSDAKTVLIIGPLNTYWGWFDTIQRQTEYAANIVRVDSSKDGRKAMLDLQAGVEGWYFVGREYFRSKDWSKIKPDYVLVDEVHFAQNRNSRSHKALMKLKSKRKLAMSGTPFGNKFEGAWAITRWLWPDKIPASYWKWVYQWCNLGYSPFTKHEVLGELEPGKFADWLPCYVRIEPNHNLEVVEETRFVDLVPAQRKIYNKFQKDLVVWLQENPLVADVPIAARVRLRQMTLAVPSVDDEDGSIYFAEDAVSTKWSALADIIDDNPDEPMLILTDSQKYAKIVTDRINKKLGKFLAFEWSGQANQKQREAAKRLFLSGEMKYIVAVIPAIAEGVDGLQNVCSTVVWLSHSDNNLMNQQVLDRIRRRGQQGIVRVYDIIARDTFDEGQLDTLLVRQLQMNATLRNKED